MKKVPEVYSGYNQGDPCPKCGVNLSTHPVGVYGYYKKVIERACPGPGCGHLDYPDTQFKPNLLIVDLDNREDLLVKMERINEVIGETA